jgi:PKD repeat protein
MSINYPGSFDADTNLYLVHDFLRVSLSEDYNYGDTSISVTGDSDLLSRFPPSGIITLTEQCSDIDERAISLSYSSRTNSTFDGLELLSGFPQVSKPKRITNVTQNVFAFHHNQIKDALIAIQNFVGLQGEESKVPLTGTIEARINFLRRLVLQPRAWFSASRKVGITPLCIDFFDQSTRQPDYWRWDFGDGTISFISRTATVTSGAVSKCFYTPAVRDIKLTVGNAFGENTITIPKYITVRTEAPDEAQIEIVPTPGQIISGNTVRARSNQDIQLLVVDNGEKPDDLIVRYTWDLQDNLSHANSPLTTAFYGVGGSYDVKLRTDTTLGSYRITSINNAMDIVDRASIWHFIFSNDNSSSVTKTLYAYEFGTFSEVYKASSVTTALTVSRDFNFLTGKNEYNKQYKEFRRNSGFTPTSLVTSGDGGNGLLFWSSGGFTDTDQQTLEMREFNGFAETWTIPPTSSLNRFWNWTYFNTPNNLYFCYGLQNYSDASVANENFDILALNTLTTTSEAFNSYENGADELGFNVADGFSVYRSVWKGENGYLVRNDGGGDFFRLKSFYRTDKSFANEIQTIIKLDDMPGDTKFEGQLVSLSQGIYFFNNTGEFLVYNVASNVWTVGGAINSTAFSELQDRSVSDYDNPANTLLAASDGDRNAYLFFDYSTKAQLKFNEADFTFTTMPVRPTGEQFSLGLY